MNASLGKPAMGPSAILFLTQYWRYIACVYGLTHNPSNFFFFLIFFFVFPSLSLSPGMGSVPGRAHFLPITLFFLPIFSPSFTLLFSPPFLSYSNFFLPLSPCLPFYSFLIFLLSILVHFFFFPCSTFITIPRSQIMSLTYIYNQC